MALIEERTDLEGGNVNIRLPGVKSGDMADRKVKPEVRNMILYTHLYNHCRFNLLYMNPTQFIATFAIPKSVIGAIFCMY